MQTVNPQEVGVDARRVERLFSVIEPGFSPRTLGHLLPLAPSVMPARAVLCLG